MSEPKDKLNDYIVEVREVHVSRVAIQATDEADAKKKVKDGEGEYLDGLDYSHTCEPETWLVRSPETDEIGNFD